MQSGPKIIIALDFDAWQQSRAFVDQLDPKQCRLKVGKALFTLVGPQCVRELQGAGFDVFLDLKFHDIPNTVAHACQVAADLGVWMLNVHCSGGRAMLEAARSAVEGYGDERPILVGVTVLTSLTAQDCMHLGWTGSLQDHVLKLAALAQQCGLDGVVCSGQEAHLLREQCGAAFTLVTPGVRLADDACNDQKRVMTPQQAMQAGSDYLVVGRSITRSHDPMQALKQVQLDMMNLSM